MNNIIRELCKNLSLLHLNTKSKSYFRILLAQ